MIQNSATLAARRDEFRQVFARDCTVVARAPGRVNLIGEHTDYNEGFVLPMALEQCTWVTAAPRADGRLRCVATEMQDDQTWPLTAWDRRQCLAWTSYPAGVAALLHASGVPLRGADLLICSDVPVGGGLSSSAALEVATALALSALSGPPLAGTRLADLCRRAEHEFAKVPCGIMDQYVSVLAQLGSAFLLDCRSRTWEHIPLRLTDHVVAVVDSGVKHALASGEYAVRQRQCRAAVEYFAQQGAAYRVLRDVTAEQVRQHAGRMDARVAARARHVVSENERTLAGAAALRSGDLPQFGRLMHASHASLRDDYEVSCPELDLLVEIVSAVPNVCGARMTGGGFGGCIVAIARRDSVGDIAAALHRDYDAAGYGPSHLIVTHPGRGAAIEYVAGT